MNMKKVIAIVVALGVVAIVGDYFMHQQKMESKRAAIAAQNQLNLNVAKQQGLTLLAPEAVKAQVAKTLNVNVTNLNFYKIELESKQHNKAWNNNSQYPNFVYEINCDMGDSRYEFDVDAQSGQVLKSKVKHRGFFDKLDDMF